MQDTCHYDKNNYKHNKDCNCDEQYQLQKELFEPAIWETDNEF